MELLAIEAPTLEAFGPAARAVAPRFEETVVSVNGEAVLTATEARATAAAVPAGQPLRILLRDDFTGVQRTIVLSRTAEQLDAHRRIVGVSYGLAFWLTYLVELLPNLIWITAGVLLFRAPRREAVPVLLSVGALGLSSLSLWDTLGDFLGSAWTAPAEVIAPAAFLCVTWALTTFPTGRLDRPWQPFALILLALACAGFAAGGLLAIFANLYPPHEDLFLPGLAVAGFLIAAAALLGRWRRTPQGLQRQQMKWAAGGLAAGLVFMLIGAAMVYGLSYVTLSYAQVVWSYLVGAGVGYFGAALVMAGLLVALLRHRLYDAESILGRSAALAALGIFAVVAWAAAETVLKDLLARVLGLESGPALSAVIATASVLLVAPARRRMSEWTRRRFQPGVEALRAEAPDRLADLKHTASLRDIADAMTTQVASAVRSVRAALVSEDGTQVDAAIGLPRDEAVRWLADHRDRLTDAAAAASADPLLPLAIALPASAEASPSRWLLLGPRPDGTLPGSDDRKAVVALAAPLGRALEAAELRELRDGRLIAEIASLREEVRALSAGRP